MKRKEIASVVSGEWIAEGIRKLKLGVSFAADVRAGQFISVFSADGSRFLPRPISVCETSPEEGTLTIVFRVVGAGTAEFSCLKRGDRVEVIGPLGNGFPVEKSEGKRLLLVGGCIGIPPMLAAGRAADKAAEIIYAVGYRSADTYLLEELRGTGRVLISTDDGSLGVHGTVLDAISEDCTEADLIFACGPKPMLRAVKAFAAEHGTECYLSMEERMACGIGVCLGCICGTTEVDEHSQVKNKRVCADGPVFRAEEVEL